SDKPSLVDMCIHDGSPRKGSVLIMKRFAMCLLGFLIVFVVAGWGQSNADNSYKPILDRLNSLTHQPELQWRTHEDIPHPEDPGLNDSDWKTWTVKNVSGPGGQHQNEEHWNGTRVFRSWIQIPEKINGYATQGGHVWLDLRFGSASGLRITVFSNGAVLYRGDDDNILPVLLTENAQPGQKFLVAARGIGDDEVQAEFFHSGLILDAPKSRPDPAQLRLELIATRPIIAAYEDGKTERQRQLDEAVKAIDFSPLDKGDQAAFDASLKAAHAKLEVLKPWLQQFTIRAV